MKGVLLLSATAFNVLESTLSYIGFCIGGRVIGELMPFSARLLKLFGLLNGHVVGAIIVQAGILLSFYLAASKRPTLKRLGTLLLIALTVMGAAVFVNNVVHLWLLFQMA